MDALTGKQRVCLRRAHRAHYRVSDEYILRGCVVFDVQEHVRGGFERCVVTVDVNTGDVGCTCAKGVAGKVWCEHCCYVALYELSLGQGVVSADVIRARRLPPAACYMTVQWAEAQLQTRVLWPAACWEDRTGTGCIPMVFDAGDGSSASMCEVMRWGARPARRAPSSLLWADAQTRLMDQATRHDSRGNVSVSHASPGILVHSFRELRRRPVVTVMHLSSGKMSCSCFQSTAAPRLWCEHCCTLALQHVAGDELHATVKERQLTAEQAYAIYTASSGPTTEGNSLLMRAAHLVGSDCPVCLNAVDRDSDYALMCSGCRIGYHVNCMVGWMGTKRNPTCPTCRKPMRGWPMGAQQQV